MRRSRSVHSFSVVFSPLRVRVDTFADSEWTGSLVALNFELDYTAALIIKRDN